MLLSRVKYSHNRFILHFSAPSLYSALRIRLEKFTSPYLKADGKFDNKPHPITDYAVANDYATIPTVTRIDIQPQYNRISFKAVNPKGVRFADVFAAMAKYVIASPFSHFCWSRSRCRNPKKSDRVFGDHRLVFLANISEPKLIPSILMCRFYEGLSNWRRIGLGLTTDVQLGSWANELLAVVYLDSWKTTTVFGLRFILTWSDITSCCTCLSAVNEYHTFLYLPSAFLEYFM